MGFIIGQAININRARLTPRLSSRHMRKIEKTIDEFVSEARAIHGDKYDYSKIDKITAISKKVIITCPVHGDFLQRPFNHLKGEGCIRCAGKKKLTTEEFIANARAVHGDKYDYSKTVYKNSKEKVEIICHEHGSFFAAPNNHVTNKSGCPSCSGYKKIDTEEFLKRAKAVHGDKYDYSKVAYKNIDTKVTIICHEHGEFSQIPYDHIKGRGCIKCGIEKCASRNRHSKDTFIRRSIEKFGENLDYGKVIYINSTTDVTITCKVHGDFSRTPNEHLNSTGCPYCTGLKPITRDEFVRRATVVHGRKYDYSKSKYTRATKRVVVTCPDHGDFLALPKDHIAKSSGCPQCAREQTSSAGEIELAEWLKSIGVDIIRNDRKTLNGMEIDIFIPELKIGIEYHGAYWHSDCNLQHPRIHERKHNVAEERGIRLITVWDFDWKSKRDLVTRHILHAIGRGNGKRIHARQCKIDFISARAANEFYSAHHLQGGVWRSTDNIGLFLNGNLIACMSFGQGISRRGKTGDSEWELIRFATSGIVRGGASKLFACFVKHRSPNVVWSYSDRQHFSGGLYRALGFTEDGRLPADYRVFKQGYGSKASGTIWHKSAWQRKHIPARLQELGITEPYDPETDPRTERQMQELARVIRIMDAGKIRWKWTA